MTTDLNKYHFQVSPFLFAAPPPPACLLPSQQIPDSKKHPGNAFCFYPNAGGTRNRRRCGQMQRSATSWLSSVLGLAGGREAWKAWISQIFFVCLRFSALDRWGKKTDISLSCPMSQSAKQDLPSVRLLSVVFLSANEFWKSENSREKVHTRCPWLHICIVYLIDENCKLHLISNSQVMGDSGKLSSDKRIYIGSSAVCEHFYSHGGLCRDKEIMADQSVRGRFLFLLRK